MKIKNITVVNLFILSFILLTSCRARFYTPNRNPVPLFKNKGDLYLDGSTNLRNKYDLTAGYAIIDGLAGYVGYGGSTLKTSSTDSVGGGTIKTNEKYQGNMLNLGVGYFLSEKQSENLRFEIFGDIALGSYKNKITGSTNEYFNGNYTRIGIMPNVGFTSNDNKFHFAYSLRYSTLVFNNDRYSNSGFWSSDIYRLKSKPYYSLLEHGLNFRIGSEKVKFQMQFGYYQGLNSDELENAIPKYNASIMLGLVLNTNLLEKL